MMQKTNNFFRKIGAVILLATAYHFYSSYVANTINRYKENAEIESYSIDIAENRKLPDNSTNNFNQL